MCARPHVRVPATEDTATADRRTHTHSPHMVLAGGAIPPAPAEPASTRTNGISKRRSHFSGSGSKMYGRDYLFTNGISKRSFFCNKFESCDSTICIDLIN